MCRKTCAHCKAKVQFFNITLLILLTVESLTLCYGPRREFSQILQTRISDRQAREFLRTVTRSPPSAAGDTLYEHYCKGVTTS